VDLQNIAFELYGLPLDEFVAARDARAAQARKEKDRELATGLKGLAKPTLGAWAVNQLVRRSRPLVERLLRIGDGLREAQRRLDGERLRELSAERRRLTAEVTAELRELGVSEAAEREALDTLAAAVAEEGAAAEVRAGTVTRVLRHSGFGGMEGMLLAAEPAAEEVAKLEPERPGPEPEAEIQAESEPEPAAPSAPVVPEPHSDPEAEPEPEPLPKVPEKLLKLRLQRALEAVEEAQLDRESARERVELLRERLQAAREKLKAAESALRTAEAERDDLQEQLDEF
jgi:hypothetical protein